MKEVILKNKQKFEKVLQDYRMSSHAYEVLQDANYVVMIGPTAAGRNTVMNELVRKYDFVQLVSDTTRPPKVRDGNLEKEGEVYFFRKEEDMLKDLEAGEFLEAELIHGQQVSGTSIRELERLSKLNKTIINEVEFGGARYLLEKKPNITVIALMPPSFSIWKKRFERREKISEQEYINRVNTFLEVLKLIKSESKIKCVVNHEYEEAAKEIAEIVSGNYEIDEDERKDCEILLKHYRDNLEKLIDSI